MAPEKPYVHYKFIGVKPFRKLLNESGIRYVDFEDRSVDVLFEKKPDHFKRSEDTISVGKCLQEGADVYFAEFGIKITKSFCSYIVFIFDHHPTVDDMLVTADDIEPHIQAGLDGIDIEDITRLQ